jgi:hypothetical protein
MIPHRNTGLISTWAIALGIGAAMTAAGTGVASAAASKARNPQDLMFLHMKTPLHSG